MVKITNAMKEYMKTIFLIQNGGNKVKTTEISKKLQVKPASVTEMIRKLASLGLLAYEPYRGIKLTEKGRDTTMDILRRHRLLERLFVDFVGLNVASACDEASKLELLLSDYAVDGICSAFNHPVTCPCGKPIYGNEGCCGR